MSKVIASITTSVDGYVTGPDDGPGCGLGVGGERLHYWVMGGPWTYEGEHAFAMSAEDRQGVLRRLRREHRARASVGRGMYDAAGAWGGTNPFGGTAARRHPPHRGRSPTPRPASCSWTASTAPWSWPRRRPATSDVAVGGGADVIRQALAGGYVDVLAISTAPVILGRGKRLFDGFEHDLDLEKVSVHSSQWATHTTYDVKR